MDSSIISVANAFNFVYNKIYREKYGMLCETSSGYKKVFKYKLKNNDTNGITTDDIYFWHLINEILHKEGFAHINRFLLTKNKLPYFQKGSDVYMVMDIKLADEKNFECKQHFLSIIKNLAKMHYILAKTTELEIPKNHIFEAQLGYNMDKTAINLATYKKKILKTAKFSEFDMLYLKTYKYFAPFIENWVKIYNNSGYALNDIALQNSYICHNQLKEENIIVEDDYLLFTNFSKASVGHFVYDLAYIIKRYLRLFTNNTNDALRLSQIIEVYEQNNPLFIYDQGFFEALLLLPNKFIKICNQYYSKNRSFVPITYLGRMQDILDTKDIIYNYILLR